MTSIDAEIETPENDFISVWPLSDTLKWLAFILLIYFVTVTKLLPNFMITREPYKMNKLLLFYNAFQVGFSIYLVFIYLRYIRNFGIITTRCPQGKDLRGVITEIYPYFFAKHMDLLDTVFFVLRKKDNQVTFLHLLHHGLMVSWTWLHLMHYPTDHFVVVGMLNSFVHVLMYAYYGIAAMGPDYAKYIWWKKHLTKIQLVQFVLVVTDLYYQQKLTPCPIPAYFHWFCIGSITTFFVLFCKFYLSNYRSKKPNQEKGGKKILNMDIELIEELIKTD